MTSHRAIRITDVSPRDGLQNEAGIVPTIDKFRLIGMLAASGVDEVEATSFVSPKWVPQLADSAELTRMINAVAALNGQSEGGASIELTPHWGDFLASAWPCEFSALVPNDKGMDALLDANINPMRPMEAPPLIQKIAIFTAASETFTKRNTNATITESLARFEPVIAKAQLHLMAVRGYISCAIACPFEGLINPAKVAQLAQKLFDMGCDEIDLGDTIGAGTPDTTRAMLDAVATALGGYNTNRLGQPVIVLHLHDTFGHASDCARAALTHGVRSFDGSVAGLGGCPYASTPGKSGQPGQPSQPPKPAPGNIATETLIATIESAGFTTSVNPSKLNEAATFARQIVTAARASLNPAPTP